MVSIIVPLHNYARYIVENINSIQSQNYEDWEIIIVDDCSSDNPYPIIRPYLSQKIQYIRLEQNVGYGASKNAGIRASKGEYIAILDSDDMLAPKSLSRRLRRMRLHNSLWCHAKAYEFNDKKPYHFRYKRRKAICNLEHILKTKKYKNLWQNIHAQTVIIHRRIYEKVGLYEPFLRTMGDKEMWARIVSNVEVPLFVDRFVAYYRMHSKQMHRSKHKKKNADKYKHVLKKLVKRRKKGNLAGVERL